MEDLQPESRYRRLPGLRLAVPAHRIRLNPTHPVSSPGVFDNKSTILNAAQPGVNRVSVIPTQSAATKRAPYNPYLLDRFPE